MNDIFDYDFFDDAIEDVDMYDNAYDDVYEDVDIFDENYFEAMEGLARDFRRKQQEDLQRNRYSSGPNGTVQKIISKQREKNCVKDIKMPGEDKPSLNSEVFTRKRHNLNDDKFFNRERILQSKSRDILRMHVPTEKQMNAVVNNSKKLSELDKNQFKEYKNIVKTGKPKSDISLMLHNPNAYNKKYK